MVGRSVSHPPTHAHFATQRYTLPARFVFRRYVYGLVVTVGITTNVQRFTPHLPALALVPRFPRLRFTFHVVFTHTHVPLHPRFTILPRLLAPTRYLTHTYHTFTRATPAHVYHRLRLAPRTRLWHPFTGFAQPYADDARGFRGLLHAHSNAAFATSRLHVSLFTQLHYRFNASPPHTARAGRTRLLAVPTHVPPVRLTSWLYPDAYGWLHTIPRGLPYVGLNYPLPTTTPPAEPSTLTRPDAPTTAVQHS